MAVVKVSSGSNAGKYASTNQAGVKKYFSSQSEAITYSKTGTKSSSSTSSSSTSSSSSTTSSSSKAPKPVNYNYDAKNETASEYNARIAKEQAAVNAYNEKENIKVPKDVTTSGSVDDSDLINSEEFKALNGEDQEAIRAVFNAIASNDKVMAGRMIESFKAAAKINDPYFKQQLRLATDAIERGYVAIDKQAEFEEAQIRTRLEDLKKDYDAKKSFMTLEQAQTMKDIQLGYEQNLDTLQTNLAESGFTSSSRRVQKEGILSEATGDLRESKNRAFEYETNTLDEVLGRSERDTANEVARLKELTKAGKLDFLRKAEQEIGSSELGKLSLNGDPSPLGGIYGDINEKKLQDTISSMTSFVF